MTLRHFTFLVLAAMIAGCAGSKQYSRLKPGDIIITLQKGACFGKCSVYKLDIYKNNMAVYTGTANTEKLGVFSKELDKNEVKALIKKFRDIGFMDMQELYPSYIEDYASVSIFFKDGKKSKTVTGKEDRPESLKQLQIQLEKIANSPGWKMEEKPQIIQPEIENVPEVQIDTEIIIEPQPNVHLARWFKKYEAYGAYLIKKIAPNLNLWLITWDTSTMKPADFLNLIRQDPEISKAEFNKTLSPREH